MTGLLLGEFITVNPSKASSNNNYQAIKAWNSRAALNLWPMPWRGRREVWGFENYLVSKVYGRTEAPEREGAACGAPSWHLEEQAGGEACPLPSDPQSPSPAPCRASTSSWGHIHIREVTTSHKLPPSGVKCLLPTHKVCSQERTNDYYLPLRPSHCFQVTGCVSLEVNAQQLWPLLEEWEPLVCQWERIW